MDIEEKTIFSANEPLLLGEFACNEIRIGEGDPHDLRSSVEVKITEACTLDGANVKVLSKFTANLKFSKFVSLPLPILIRPGYFYSISINGFPDGHYFKAYRQLTSEPDLEIEFHDGVDKNVGLIYELTFNEILIRLK